LTLARLDGISDAGACAKNEWSMNERLTSQRLDLSGLKCPLPVLRARKALRAMAPGGELEVVCTDPMSALDIPNMVREEGCALIAHDEQDAKLFFRIRRGP
jgi:tRNA 2-thiouridine synthesizing protein A